ncbi:hypothetical protein STEG23_018668, partial [Scotinomys teguina]
MDLDLKGAIGRSLLPQIQDSHAPTPPQDVIGLSWDEHLCTFPPDTIVCQSDRNPPCSSQIQAPQKVSLLSPADAEDLMLLPGTNSSLLLVQRTVTRTIVLQETISK